MKKVDSSDCDACIFALAAKFHIEPHDAVRSSVACIKDSFWWYFSKLVWSFCIIFVCFVMYFIVHAAFVRIKLMMIIIDDGITRPLTPG